MTDKLFLSDFPEEKHFSCLFHCALCLPLAAPHTDLRALSLYLPTLNPHVLQGAVAAVSCFVLLEYVCILSAFCKH